jgi:hypothetical protein
VSVVMRELERVERRVLGALRCVDATTGAGIDAPLNVTVESARIQRNQSGLYVIAAATALAEHEATFTTPPALPAIGSVQLSATLADPSGHYLPRRTTLNLPRDPQPTHAANTDSLFRPVEVAMFPSSVAQVGENWAVLHVSLGETNTGDALGGALLILANGATILARGLTDWRGEALLPVPGVPVTTWSTDPHAVVVSEIDVQIRVVFDPASGTRTSAADVSAGRAPALLPTVDPDDIETRVNALPNASVAATIAARRVQSLSCQLALP